MTSTNTNFDANAQQGINSDQTLAAIFLVLNAERGPENVRRIRQASGNIDKLVHAIAARDTSAHLSCVTAFGSEIWEPLFGSKRPRELHPFRPLRSGPRIAPATPGDILLHIRAERMDMCFELAAQFMGQLVSDVTVADEVHGFRYFDDRDLTGFVDGTENPSGALRVDSTLVGDEDAGFTSGSYVIVQKYLHDLHKWNSQSVETQEHVIGRTKLEDIDLDDSVKPSNAHNALTTLVENGDEVKILRHNMPFGNAGGGESGTYFIGYARSPRPIEQMLENMFIGRPPGNYDRLLDFTHAVTGTNFFAPSVPLLSSLATSPDLLEPAAGISPLPKEVSRSGQESAPAKTSRSLNIGSLKGVSQHE